MEETRVIPVADPNRKKFRDIFEELSDGALKPRIQIHLNGLSFGPGLVFQKGVIFGGIDFHLYKYYDVATSPAPDGGLNILGFYKDS